MFKEMFLFSLGTLSLTKEKAEHYYQELIERGQMNKTEARQFINNVMEKGEEEKRTITALIRNEIEALEKRCPFVRKDKYEELETRVRELEQKLQNIAGQ
ncbi:MAG TPA: hypothetical protein GX697_02145 [Firmicutes bacterium]|nr:hypothetical protein [Bacillota bacterium]